MTDLALDHAFAIRIGEADIRFPTPFDRLIHFRTGAPQLAELAPRGLSYLATHARERHFETGELVYRPEEPVSSVHFVVEGFLRVEQEGIHLLDCTPPNAIGFLPSLSASEIGQRAVAMKPTVTLEISRRDLLEIFEDDFGFLENGIRSLSRQLAGMQAELEVRGLLPRSEPEATPYPRASLDLVERLALIRGGPYAEVNLEPLVDLITRSREIRVEPGTVLWEEGDASTWGLQVVHGVVLCSSKTRNFRMGPKSLVGLFEANGALPRSYRAVAETRLVALEQQTDVFYDVLEDNLDLALGMLSFVSKITLDLQVRLATARQNDPR
jgi:CRP-like cAMP-binding protein